MKTELIENNGIKIAKVVSTGIVINEVQDALDLMADGYSVGVNRIIIKEGNLSPGFFDLSTRIAGEILQKFATYNVLLAIVGDFGKYTSKSFKDFIYESNKTGRIVFVSSVEEAVEKLSV
jgi:hypothetical protein